VGVDLTLAGPHEE